MSDWQPIKTVPKDGSKVRLKGTLFIGWEGEEQPWEGDSMWSSDSVNFGWLGTPRVGDLELTHWMPLPEPPEPGT